MGFSSRIGSRKVALLLALSVASMPLTACTFLDSFVPKKGETSDVIDRQQNLTVDDFRNMNNVDKLRKDVAVQNGKDGKDEPVVTATLGTPPLPDMAQVLAAPHAPKVANTKLVTLSVTEDVPLRDVLFELGRLANVDIEVGNGLDTTGINLRATDRPFNEVIEKIAHLANLRYSVSGNSIRVERDTPYIKNYSLDFLNLVRSSTSTYNLSTNVLSGGGGGGSSSGSSGSGFGTTGSTNNITSQGESDLFSSLEASIAEIVNYMPDGEEEDSKTGGAGKAGAAGAAGAAPKSGKGAAAGGANGKASGGNANFVVNRQSNVLTVNATEAQHEMVQRYLTLLSHNASAQVLIEAKIVEVELSDQYLSGVNWAGVIGGGSPVVSPGTFLPPATTGLTSPTFSQLENLKAASVSATTSGVGAFSFGIQNKDLNAVVSLTQQFGTTRTLSSPRLSAINNQQAVLTFAKNEVFFNCSAQAGAVVANTGTPGTQASQPTVSCTQQTVPIGIIMSILPSINLTTQEVTLNVRPTLTRQVGTVPNPGNLLAAAVVQLPSTVDVSSPVPVIEVRELDSVMKIKSGGVMVIGGLMEDNTNNTDTGVPGASEIPILGNLFKSRSEDSQKHELIIFIKATILNTDGSAHETDKLIYDKYTTDPRPLFPKP